MCNRSGHCLIGVVVLGLSGCMDDHSAAGTATALGDPNAELAEDFGLIETVREQWDGTLLVADPVGLTLYLVDMEAGTRSVVGAEGMGPNEYLQPDAVWPLPGDSTLLVDVGNGRLVVLGPDLQFGSTMPIAMGELGAPGGVALALPQGVDAQGRIYVPVRGQIPRDQSPDSGAILRIDRSTRQVDTVGTFNLIDLMIVEGSGGRGTRTRPIQFSPEDAWGVAPDGSVAVARAGGYQLDWIAPDGTVRRGLPISVPSMPVERAGQERWLAEQDRRSFFVSVRGGPGGPELHMERGGRGFGEATAFDDIEWAEVPPAVYPGRLLIDANGHAWARRYVEASRPPTYDVFDRAGDRIATIELKPERAVVGFGRDAVYVVRFDEFDLNYLERYAMPVL